MTFPGGAPSDTEAFAHLASRFVTAAAFVYGVETLLSHPDLGTTSSCVVHAGSDSPYFGIVGATADADGFVLTLTPTSPARVFSYMSMKLVYNPNITGEVIKRRAAGLDVGDERRLGTGKTLTTKLADFSLNWDKVNKKATTEKLALIGTSSLYCNNCYFYLDASITVNVKVCAIRPTLLPLSYYYYDADAATGNSASSTGICGAGAAGCYATEAAARASTDCGDLKTVAGFFNLGMSVEGYFDGAAGFNFEIKSDGIASKVGWPTSCQSDSATCAPEAFPAPLNAPFAINTITISAAGVPVTIDPVIQLKGAGIVDGNMPNLKLSFGASAAVKAKLGAKVSFTDIPSSYVPALNTVPYKDFTATYSTLPFILSGFADTALSTDVTISPIITLTVWKLVPIISKPTYTFNYNLAAKTTARRLGNNGSAARELVTCAAGTAKSSAGLKGALGVELGSVRTFGVVKAATGLDLSTLGSLASQFDVILIPATVLVANAAIDVSGALSATAAEMCVTKDVPVNTGTAINAAVGSSGSGSASDSSSPIANTPLAVWLGLGLGVGLGLAIPLIALSIYTSRLLRRMEKAKNNLTMTSTGAFFMSTTTRSTPRARAPQ